jgi:hypothetical protein
MSATNPTPEEREVLAKLINDWIDSEFGGNMAAAVKSCRIPRATLGGYCKSKADWPREENKLKLAKVLGLTLDELNAKITGAQLKSSMDLAAVIREIRLRTDEELIAIDRAITDVRESRLKPRPRA